MEVVSLPFTPLVLDRSRHHACETAPAVMIRSQMAGTDEIRIDVFGATVLLSRREVTALREAAAARAGVSSRHRDLSLVLNRALETGGVSLTRPELTALFALVEEAPARFASVGGELRRAAARRDG
jgi:hypothetical protein